MKFKFVRDALKSERLASRAAEKKDKAAKHQARLKERNTPDRPPVDDSRVDDQAA